MKGNEHILDFDKHIQDYNISKKYIHVDMWNGSHLQIEKVNFWDWVQENGYDEWCIDFHDPAQHDGHGQRSGSMDMHEFLTRPHKELMADIFEYLLFAGMYKKEERSRHC